MHLRAERKSPATLKVYGDGVRRFLSWCEATGTPAVLDRPTVSAFVVALLYEGAEPATARLRQLAVRRFSASLAEEGETERDELLGMKPLKACGWVAPTTAHAPERPTSPVWSAAAVCCLRGTSQRYGRMRAASPPR